VFPHPCFQIEGTGNYAELTSFGGGASPSFTADLSVSAFLDPAAPFKPSFAKSSNEISIIRKLLLHLSIYKIIDTFDSPFASIFRVSFPPMPLS
jgi:hypothetical protein